MDKSSFSVLIVEDEKPMSDALCYKFTKEGCKITLAKNGKEALAAIEHETFNAILLDLFMPVMDGFEVLETLQKKRNATPVIVLTNLNNREDEVRAKSLGAKEYVVKSSTALTEIVKQTLNAT